MTDAAFESDRRLLRELSLDAAAGGGPAYSLEHAARQRSERAEWLLPFRAGRGQLEPLPPRDAQSYSDALTYNLEGGGG